MPLDEISFPEPLPPTVDNKNFPLGDVINAKEEEMDLILKELMESSRDEKRKVFNKLSKEGSNDFYFTYGRTVDIDEIDELINNWNAMILPEYELGGKIMKNSFFSTVNFVHRGRLLPPLQPPIIEVIRGLKNHDYLQIEYVSGSAWTTMRLSHPRVYRFMRSFYEEYASFFCPESEGAALLIDSAVVLPYLLSSGSRLIGYMEQALKDDREPRI